MFQRWGACPRWGNSLPPGCSTQITTALRSAQHLLLWQEIIQICFGYICPRQNSHISAWKALHNNSEALERNGGEREGGGRRRGGGLRPVMHGAGQEAASIPAASCLAWHSIKKAVLGPVKSSSRRGSCLCRDAAGVPGHGRGEKPETLPNSLVIMRRKIRIPVSPLRLQQQWTFVQLFSLHKHFVCYPHPRASCIW